MYKSTILFLSVIRYLGIILSSIVSLTVAKLVTPKDYADWSMYLLIIQYFTILTLGMEHGVGQITSLKFRNRKLVDVIFIVSLVIVLIIFLFLFIVVCFLNFEQIKFLREYNLYDKLGFILISATLFNFINIGSNFLRAIGKLTPVVLSVMIFPSAVLLFLLYGNVSFERLVCIHIASFGLTLFFYCFKIGEINFSIFRLTRLTRILISKSLKLLFFNIAVSLVLWSVKFLFAIFESKLFFSSLSLAFSINQAYFLIIVNITYLNYPKLLRLAKSNTFKNYEYLASMNEFFLQICLMFSVLSFIISPVVNLFFTKYYLFQKALFITNTIQVLLLVPTLVYILSTALNFQKKIGYLTIYFIIYFSGLVYMLDFADIKIPIWITFIICYIFYLVTCYKLTFKICRNLKVFYTMISVDVINFIFILLILLFTAQLSYSLAVQVIILIYILSRFFINFSRYKSVTEYLFSHI